ncbi:MAG: 2-oxoacid:acceptor oxidoreductase subunit alpha [Anaerolineae bacterium]|jgi:2-oxoglutarate ferredoxin oxidoreductase subunit alpha|nr:2-oxoacid:acceptor oxidoreductase subunit alpha [Anaerolineae bacterium]MBT4309769.1 2-oxoacid:acceptor oxidoreductase subunit alpha [Anaerolineae bacterium]MBT4457990.1 2-oxoacid:acceptor oxidoreductase subunit alpha [Anaerolineae bacterium]MBT4841334.1 2-oxoacid:acceptor oxidoreductase subunit alpha [Anaerolineae bacterium]MBT6061545.1 2-oxoacid:acceptor oxidoreductase subunit alpha [Anaerolineae bacterium]
MTNKIINDFSITVGTANGSGSQTSNLTILRALFKMGIPVTGKNMFPSNIQGLPTWYTIRLSKDGYTARRDEHEIVVAMNPESFERDVEDVLPGGVLFYNNSIKTPIERDDITAYPMEVKGIIKEAGIPSSLRTMVSNMVYIGVLAQMLGIEIAKIKMALDFHFKGKEKPVAINMNVIEASAAWASENLEKTDNFFVEPMDKTDGLIMADGNTAAALGSIYGGVQVVGWYPITPATSLVEKMSTYLPKLRMTKDDKATYAIVQAEDELAALGITIGGAWSGARAMTSTSGAGISLMGEYVGLAYFAEVPLVIWNIQRMGPSTGLPTRTSQGDLKQAVSVSHGDTKHIVLLPGSARECFEFGWKAFDVAERTQTPVFVLSDLDLGQNQWMSEPFEYPDIPMDRGKVLWEEDFEEFEAKHGKWGRYKDVDGDGIPYRTVAGNRHVGSTYFARGTGHDAFANYSEDPDVWMEGMNRLNLKYETARQYVPDAIIEEMEDSKIGIIAYGSTTPAVIEARDLLAKEGVKTDYLRLRALPINDIVKEFVRKYDEIFVVEMNHNGQLREILSIEMPEESTKMTSSILNNGLSLTAEWIRDDILAKKEK